MTDKPLYREPNQVKAILFGYLIRNEGKVQQAKMNKLLGELGYDKTNVQELKEFSKLLSEEEELDSLVEQAIEGEVGLDQLTTPSNSDTKPLEDKSIADIITPYIVDVKRNQKTNRAFNKARREGAYIKILLEDLKEELKKDLPSITSPKPFEYDRESVIEGSTLVVTLSDLHIGKLVKSHPHVGIGYNYAILQERLEVYLEEINRLANLHEVTDIRCYFVGDAIENTNMRSDQSFSAEFDTGEQTSKAIRTIAEFLRQLELIAPVTFGMVKGNHDRIAKNKKEAIHNESFAYIILSMIDMMNEEGFFSRLTIINNLEEMRLFVDEVHGKRIAVTHGDFIKGNKNKIGQLGLPNIDILVTGHLHTFGLNQENGDTYHLQVGSVVGNDEYAAENNLSSNTIPSQSILVINPNQYKGLITYSPYLTTKDEEQYNYDLLR